MFEWSNWSGALTANPTQIHFIRSEADAQALAAHASKNRLAIRVAGATHSHAPLVKHDGIITDLRGLSGVISTDQQEKTAWVWSGTRIHSLGRPLHDAGLALANQGDIDQQAICGATATGTHGTGTTLKNLSSAVIGAKIALASGELVTCGPNENTELWQACRLSLGALGIITQLKLQLVDAYRLEEQQWQANLVDALEEFHDQAAQHRHHEFFWYPQSDRAQGKSISLTEKEAEYPLAEEGKRCAWSYEVLPNHRPHKHTEMEYSVPSEAARTCMQDIQHLLSNDFSEVQWPVEFRTLASDDVWLSSAYERETVTISVHEDIRRNDEPYFKACEEIFLAHQGRPHWGKVNYLNGAQLQAIHPKWDDWWAIRDQVDPNGTFLNHYLKSIRPR